MPAPIVRMSTADDGDLSSYERARLANIARNRALLQQLGLAGPADSAPPVKAALALAFSPATARKPKREARISAESEGLRRSSRLLAAVLGNDGDAAAAAAQAAADSQSAADDAKSSGLDLDYQDEEVLQPEQLDDFEFEVYTLLRTWRLATCRALDTEPYKIFQNRTLVEAVRRRRNDSAWGSTQQQLLQCWGIGPVKVQHMAIVFCSRCCSTPPLTLCTTRNDAVAGAKGRLRVDADRANAAARGCPPPAVIQR